jgi:hypothetical protein
MASILSSFEIAKKNSSDLVYFVEDDYIHSRESLGEMVLTYEKIASEINRDLFLCSVDYPYLYKKTETRNYQKDGDYIDSYKSEYIGGGNENTDN